jgi:hypothetical protein
MTLSGLAIEWAYDPNGLMPQTQSIVPPVRNYPRDLQDIRRGFRAKFRETQAKDASLQRLTIQKWLLGSECPVSRRPFGACRPQPDLAMAYLLAAKAPFAGSNNAPRSAAS